MWQRTAAGVVGHALSPTPMFRADGRARLLPAELVRILRRDGVALTVASKVLSRVRLLPGAPDTFVVAEAIERTISSALKRRDHPVTLR